MHKMDSIRTQNILRKSPTSKRVAMSMRLWRGNLYTVKDVSTDAAQKSAQAESVRECQDNIGNGRATLVPQIDLYK